jgi:hypothetical protein
MSAHCGITRRKARSKARSKARGGKRTLRQRRKSRQGGGPNRIGQAVVNLWRNGVNSVQTTIANYRGAPAPVKPGVMYQPRAQIKPVLQQSWLKSLQPSKSSTKGGRRTRREKRTRR